MYSAQNNYYNQNQNNPYGQAANKGYHPNNNTDIYGKPIINPHQLTQEKNTLLKEVEKTFNVKTLTNQMINNIKGDIININLQIKNDLILPIEIACDDMFPYTCPRITIKRKIKHEKIDPKSMEFQFYNDYKWNYQLSKSNCNLLLLITFIQTSLQKNPPQTDILFEQYQKLEVHTNNELKILESLNCYNLFPNKSKDELKSMVNYSQTVLDNFIVKNDNYKKAVQSLIDLIEFNQKNMVQINDKRKSLEYQKTELDSMAQLFDFKKDNLATKFTQTNMIKERFNKTKILNVLEQEIGKLDDEGCDNVEFNFKKSSQMNNQFDQKLSEYFETRKKYHRYVIKKEKLEQII